LGKERTSYEILIQAHLMENLPVLVRESIGLKGVYYRGWHGIQ